MPTYEYQCKDCRFEFEEFQSIASEPLHVCPKCGGIVERKISGGTGLIFKGSGFYITDYKKNKPNNNKPSSKKKEKEKSETKAS
jgi:putative FmdB family regulatory protein